MKAFSLTMLVLALPFAALLTVALFAYVFAGVAVVGMDRIGWAAVGMFVFGFAHLCKDTDGPQKKQKPMIKY